MISPITNAAHQKDLIVSSRVNIFLWDNVFLWMFFCFYHHHLNKCYNYNFYFIFLLMILLFNTLYYFVMKSGYIKFVICLKDLPIFPMGIQHSKPLLFTSAWTPTTDTNRKYIIISVTIQFRIIKSGWQIQLIICVLTLMFVHYVLFEEYIWIRFSIW